MDSERAGTGAVRPMSDTAFRLMEGVMALWYVLARRPRRDLQLLPLERGLTVVDYCCGPGHYTLPIAEAVGPEGRVYAVDIQPLAVAGVREKAARRGLRNVTAVLVDSYHTGLPEGCAGLAVFLDAFHMVGDPEALLAEIHRLLVPGGRLFMDPGHLKTPPVLARVERTGLFSLLRLSGSRMLLARREPA